MIERHATTRARERYGLELTLADLQAVADQIRDKRDAVFMRRGHNGSEVWGVKVQGIWTRAVLSPDTGKIITFLPAERTRRAG